MDNNRFNARQQDHQLQNIIDEVHANRGESTAFGNQQAAVSRTISNFDTQKTTRKRIPPYKIMAIIGGAFLALLCILTVYTYLYPGIHHGMRAGHIKIGGMEPSKAQMLIGEHGKEQLSGKQVELSIYDQIYPIAVESVTDGLDSAATAKAAYAYTHEGGFFTRLGHTMSTLVAHHTIPLQVLINEEALAARLDEISNVAMTEPINPSWSVRGNTLIVDRGRAGVDFERSTVKNVVSQKISTLDFMPYEVQVEVSPQESIDMNKIKEEADCEPKNATVDKNDGKTIVPSVQGVVVDVAAAEKIIDASEQQTYTIPITRTNAKIDGDALAQVLFRDTLGSASTNYKTSNSDRATNVRLSTEYCNAVILNPGDVFSYNESVGKRTAVRGFKAAGAYLNGELVSELGGGVCQPSSTLYMAVLRADLKIVERSNHTYVSSYTPLGEDATVSWGGPDFQFENNTEYPVKIQADASGRKVAFQIVGTNVTGKTVTTERKVLATYSPKIVEEKDATLELGKTSVKQHGYTGYKVKVYQVITENGKTTRVLANTSTYKKKDRIILVGTKQPEAEEVITPSVDAAADAEVDAQVDPEMGMGD